MTYFINHLIRKIVRWILPIPILSDFLADFFCRYKIQVLSIMAGSILFPFILVISVFATPPTSGEPATRDKALREYFDRKYDIQCREKLINCEVKPTFRGQTVDCTVTPSKCRKIRNGVDCSLTTGASSVITTLTNSSSQNITSNSTTTSNSSNVSSSSISNYCHLDSETNTNVKNSDADEQYYLEQQKKEEDGFNIFNWLGSLFGNGNNNQGTQNTLNWNDPANAPSIGSIPDAINTYIEPGFVDSGIIQKNPFGQSGYSTNCGYLCYSNSIFGTHLGTDLSPGSGYFSSNKASQKLNGKPVFFATCSGTAKTRYTSVSGNMIEIHCKDSNYWVSYYHVREPFIPLDSYVSVKAGQPVGVMGGEAGEYWSGAYTTGVHLHYQINLNCLQYDFVCTRNPDDFLST